MADKTWPDFRKYWMDAYKMYDNMNKLTATESGFGANAMEENGGTSGKDVEWDSSMDNLVAIISSEKRQIETIIATNATLVEQKKAKDLIIGIGECQFGINHN